MNEKNKYDEIFDSLLEEEKSNNESSITIFSLPHQEYEQLKLFETEVKEFASNKINDSSFPAKIKILKYFLPRQIREEFMGDIYELVAEMKNEGRKKWFIWVVVIFQYTLVILGQLKSFIPFTSSNKEIADK